jgi:hypothetical protein
MNKPRSFLLFSLLVLWVGVAQAAPTQVKSLTVTSVGPGSITLAWSTPSPGAGATLQKNDVRCSTAAITIFTWPKIIPSTVFAILPGTVQTVEISGLKFGTSYVCAQKTLDSSGVWSLVSNNTPAKTTLTREAELAWTAPYWTDGPLTGQYQVGLLGYKVCSVATGQCINVGNVTSVVLTGLPAGTSCWFLNAYFDRRPFETAYGPSTGYTDPNIPYLIGSFNSDPVCRTFLN